MRLGTFARTTTVALLVGAMLAGCGSDDGGVDGKRRLTLVLDAQGLLRGKPGPVVVGARARYVWKNSDDERTSVIATSNIRLALVDASGGETALTPGKGGWKSVGGDKRADIALPEVVDGDYKLRLRARTSLGEDSLDLPLALYAPARIHVITDRPLYEPGNLVRFRAVALRARDLSPLDKRPGVWIVTDPAGEVLLEEKAPAGDFGVVAGSFPLDREAATGAWRVRWASGDTSDEVSFTVEPFTLPRFSIEASADKPFYRAGDKPVLKGKVSYSSGAPVANADVELEWRSSGAWPPPTGWLDKVLPRKARSGPSGRFELTLPAIPGDLQGQATLSASLSAVDAAGDRVEGGASLLLSQDAIQVSTVTELGDGLVDGFNNRMFLRVSNADGSKLEGATIHVKRAWSPSDKGLDAELDEDGVARVQLDPGPPVNVLVPALPVRLAPKPEVVRRGETSDLLSSEGVSLADQVALDGWVASLEPCAKWTEESAEVTVALHIGTGGNVLASASDSGALERCVLDAIKGKRVASGGDRLLSVDFQFENPDLPRLEADMEAVLEGPEELGEALEEATRGARDCLPDVEPAAARVKPDDDSSDDSADADFGSLPRALVWRTREHSKVVEIGWVKDPEGGLALASQRCAESRLKNFTLEEEAESDGMGLVRFTVIAPERIRESKPEDTVMLGYELRVSAEVAGKEVGATTLRMTPGAVPPLRLRAEPVLAKVGDKLEVELIRGPDYTGDVPEKVYLRHLEGTVEAKLDEKTRKATFTVDAKIEGWCELSTAGVRALVYVRPAADLAVAVKPAKDRYAPGQTAELELETKVSGQPGQAAVGLFGVDQSLGQLVTLPGADDLGRVRPQVTMTSNAFGTLDGQALALGRIRGANAAMATILRVQSLPTAAELDAVVYGRAETLYDPVAELTDRFYVVLGELHEEARRWEASAPASEKMMPATMVKLWNKALAAAEAKGTKVVDFYGRRLRLSKLPGDLLALTDPRMVVIDGARRPEDVQNWSQYVARERP